MHRLPDGAYTEDDHAYTEAWLPPGRQFAATMAALTGETWQLHSCDPDYAFTIGYGTKSIPASVVQTFNAVYAELTQRRLADGTEADDGE